MADAYGNVIKAPSGITQKAEVKPVEILFSTHGLVQKGATLEPGNGLIEGGTLLGVVTASGRYAPYASGALDGTQTPVGFLRQSVETGADAGAEVVQGNIVLRGNLKNDALTGVDAGAITALNARVDADRNLFAF